ncbi:MAG: glycosyltransferase [Herbinix sp.]|nr:glycosyltransferase [Herbinix sp.]
MIGISVIVPVYNVERYLRYCLDSLIQQTMQNIEIIVINDNSPDNSAGIMKEYELKYNNIRTIYLSENRCLGGARNAGIDLARGKYIMFVDSDDSIDADYCEKMYSACEETGSEMAFSGYLTLNENFEKLDEKLTYPIDFSGRIDDSKRKGFINKGVVAWGKIFRLDLWNNIKLRFPEHVKYEDAPTIPIYLLHTKSCCYVDGTFYRYLVRENSILRTRNTGHDDAQITALLFWDRMKQYGFADKFSVEIEHFMVERYYSVFLRRCIQLYDKVSYDKMESSRKDIQSWFPDYRRNIYIHAFVAEDRIRMMMNEISPQTCEQWDKNYKDSMNSDYQLMSSMYQPFYYKNETKIKNILKGECFGLWGSIQKRKAFLDFVSKTVPNVKLYNFSKETIYQDIEMNHIECIIVVNPSAYLSIFKEIQNYKEKVKLINLEDILHGYIDLYDGAEDTAI